MRLARLLTAARTAAGLTQAQLGFRIHRTGQTISQYESGARTPTVRRVLELAQALGLDEVQQAAWLHAHRLDAERELELNR